VRGAKGQTSGGEQAFAFFEGEKRCQEEPEGRSQTHLLPPGRHGDREKSRQASGICGNGNKSLKKDSLLIDRIDVLVGVNHGDPSVWVQSPCHPPGIHPQARESREETHRNPSDSRSSTATQCIQSAISDLGGGFPKVLLWGASRKGSPPSALYLQRSGCREEGQLGFGVRSEKFLWKPKP